MTTSISYPDLEAALRGPTPPILIDVRREPAFLASSDMAAGALRRVPDEAGAWCGALPRANQVVVYCVHGHEVSQGVARTLRERGINALFLEGGLEEGWRTGGGAIDPKPAGGATRWVTRERPKIDRIACPWLISRFVDSRAEFLYAPATAVREVAQTRGAIPYDIPDVRFSHSGPHCSFDAFLEHYRLTDPALLALARIVRGADTGDLALAPQAPGLLAISLGLARICPDDGEMLEKGMVVYDALYAWCRDGQDETHTWNPAALRDAAT
jgi:rhodanese-related sulfurtransferase